MKIFIAVLAVAALCVIGAMGYAHEAGVRSCENASMQGGCKGHWGGPGPSHHVMGAGGGHEMHGKGHGKSLDTKFLDETVDLRKELHEKKFDYFEANRNPETDPDSLAKLEKEIDELQSKIAEKAPHGSHGGYGHCW